MRWSSTSGRGSCFAPCSRPLEAAVDGVRLLGEAAAERMALGASASCPAAPSPSVEAPASSRGSYSRSATSESVRDGRGIWRTRPARSSAGPAEFGRLVALAPAANLSPKHRARRVGRFDGCLRWMAWRARARRPWHVESAARRACDPNASTLRRVDPLRSVASTWCPVSEFRRVSRRPRRPCRRCSGSATHSGRLESSRLARNPDSSDIFDELRRQDTNCAAARSSTPGLAFHHSATTSSGARAAPGPLLGGPSSGGAACRRRAWVGRELAARTQQRS